jgi:hypothetical protein
MTTFRNLQRDIDAAHWDERALREHRPMRDEPDTVWTQWVSDVEARQAALEILKAEYATAIDALPCDEGARSAASARWAKAQAAFVSLRRSGQPKCDSQWGEYYDALRDAE